MLFIHIIELLDINKKHLQLVGTKKEFLIANQWQHLMQKWSKILPIVRKPYDKTHRMLASHVPPVQN